MPQAADNAEKGGPVIAAFIVRELETSRAMAASVQARGIAVISSAGTLVTLLLGLVAITTDTTSHMFLTSAKYPLCLAAMFLVLAAVAGIITNAPRRGQATDFDSLRPLLGEKLWHVPAGHAEQEVAKVQLNLAHASRQRNSRMARWLLYSIILEILGVACLAWCIVVLVVIS